jgi:hypothetical protein
MAASLDDILTAQKNGVVAINNIATSNLRGQGTQTSVVVTAPTLVFAAKGFLVNFSVTVAGSAAGTINNSATVAGAAAANVLCVTPTTVGVSYAGQVFSNGLVVSPGTGQSINVTYSTG